MRSMSFAALLLLSACAPAQQAEVTMARSLDDSLTGPALPAMQAFAPMPGRTVQRANSEIAADFLDLSFRMESGRTLPVLLRGAVA